MDELKYTNFCGISLFKQVTSETWFRATSMCRYSLGVCSKVEWLKVLWGTNGQWVVCREAEVYRYMFVIVHVYMKEQNYVVL